jgi:ABC-type proline/glycine betaine transport system permease subunit
VTLSNYAQLEYSPLLLALTVAGLAWVYLVPVLAAIFGHGAARICGLMAWTVMAVAFQPILRFYRLTPLWGPLLPAIAAVYMAFTLESAYQSSRGRGGLWKGRVQGR